MRTIAACALALTLASSAQAADVDWKMYGAASVAGPEFCFYDGNSAARTSNGYVRVWTKCLAQSELDGVDAKGDLNDKIVNNAADKIAGGYIPPIVAVGQMEFKQIPDIAVYEEIADLAAIQPHAQIFYELNCSGRMGRRLSMSLHVNGRDDFQKKPSDW